MSSARSRGHSSLTCERSWMMSSECSIPTDRRTYDVECLAGQIAESVDSRIRAGSDVRWYLETRSSNRHRIRHVRSTRPVQRIFSTDHLRRHASLVLLLRRHLRVSGRRRVDGEALGVTDVGNVREELEVVDERLAGLRVKGEGEGEG